MGLRLAIGSCRCTDGLKSSNPKVKELCSRIVTRLNRLRALPGEILITLPETSAETERIEGQVIALNTYCDRLETGDTLIVVQGFLPSWWFPKYFGPAGIGHMFAEGILVTQSGAITEPEEEILWYYR